MSLKQRLDNAVAVHFFLPSPALRPYVTTYYLTEVALPAGHTIEDRLHPEWANIRFRSGGECQAAIGAEPLRAVAPVSIMGPTSRATHFIAGTMRAWGIGLLPLGWARFVAAPACAYADRFVDGAADPAFAPFVALSGSLGAAAENDPREQAALIDRFMLDLLDRMPEPEDAARIQAAHEALFDAQMGTVADLALRLAMSARSFERLSLRAFGFSPKLLLRRQRFTRSLGQFMLDPSLKWISTLDDNYVDQAHFVRDFRRFMGMCPSSYAALDHPVLAAAAQARTVTAGAAMQVLHQP